LDFALWLRANTAGVHLWTPENKEAWTTARADHARRYGWPGGIAARLAGEAEILPDEPWDGLEL
jgi:hypothetical protein